MSLIRAGKRYKFTPKLWAKWWARKELQADDIRRKAGIAVMRQKLEMSEDKLRGKESE